MGVAPDAQWIAVKIFNNQGSGTVAGIHAGFQWLLDPDGNPNTDDAPHVVNNSWTFQSPGCDLEFQPDLQALRAAGILPILQQAIAGPMQIQVSVPATIQKPSLSAALTITTRCIKAAAAAHLHAGEGVTTFLKLLLQV